jgi:hypothetical protein
MTLEASPDEHDLTGASPRPAAADAVSEQDRPGAQPSQGRPSEGSVHSAARRDRKRGLLLLTAALVLGVFLPLLMAALTGNLSIPHNDAWSYSRIAQTFGKTGHVVLLDWNRSALIGQFLPLGPLAASLVVQQVYVAALGVVALLSIFDLLKPRLGGQRAGLAVCAVALWPGFGLLATSFMADVPALAAVFASLALGRRALERDSLLLGGLALAAGLWGGTVRAQSLAAPAALLVYALFTYRRRERLRLVPVLVGAVACAAAFLAFNAWHSGLPNGDAPTVATVRYTLDTTVNLSVVSYFTLALPLSPIVLLTARPWRWSRAALITAAATAVVGVMAVHDFTVRFFFLGNYLNPDGAYSAVMEPGDHRAVFSTRLWSLLVALAVLSGALLAGSLVRRWRGIDPLLGLFTGITALGTLGTALTGQGIYDRYLIALAPAALSVLLAQRSQESNQALDVPARRTADLVDARISKRLNQACAAVAALAVGALAFALAANAYSYDAARWRAAQQLVATGVPAHGIDAGLEWLGFHSPHGVTDRQPSGGPMGWETFFSKQPSCYAVTGGLHEPDWTLQRTVKYRTFLIARTSTLYVFATNASGCS